MATEKVIKKLCKQCNRQFSDYPCEPSECYLLDAVENAVEVIRCKDCKKWFRHTEVDRERGECRRYQTTKHEAGYCDRGERKDNEQ